MSSLTPQTRSRKDDPSAAGASRRRPGPVADVTADPSLGEIEVSWSHVPWKPLLDYYAIHAARGKSPSLSPDTLLGKTVYSGFSHIRLGPEAQSWTYRIVVVDAAGKASRASQAVSATSVESVVVRGHSIVHVGSFDGKDFELALAPDGYASYPDQFPDDVDFEYGVDAPDEGWCYIHPGPNDAWAGSRSHAFSLHFDIDEVPSSDVTLAIWLIDAHRFHPGAAVISLNGSTVTEWEVPSGATRGHLLGDSTKPDSPLRPSYEEIVLPHQSLKAGRNIITVDKVEGSYHVYDAIGLFAG